MSKKLVGMNGELIFALRKEQRELDREEIEQAINRHFPEASSYFMDLRLITSVYCEPFNPTRATLTFLFKDGTSTCCAVGPEDWSEAWGKCANPLTTLNPIDGVGHIHARLFEDPGTRWSPKSALIGSSPTGPIMRARKATVRFDGGFRRLHVRFGEVPTKEEWFPDVQALNEFVLRKSLLKELNRHEWWSRNLRWDRF